MHIKVYTDLSSPKKLLDDAPEVLVDIGLSKLTLMLKFWSRCLLMAISYFVTGLRLTKLRLK